MDRSFLADKDVISTSRKFVCIRLATYENAEENEVLKGFFARGGNLENTVFTLLTPDGKTKLVTAGRSPVWAFGGVSGPGINAQPEESMKKMGQTMEAIALVYPGKGKAAKGFPPLPYLADLRLALNVTAADRQPLVVVYSKSAEQRKKMERELSKVAWSDQFIGEAQYVPASDASEFKSVKNFKATSGFVVIQPGTFGLTGEVIEVIEAATPARKIAGPLAEALGKHKPSQLTYDQHRQAGSRAGARWQSATPNTDGLSRRGGGRRPQR
jgi:hypothetical protein